MSQATMRTAYRGSCYMATCNAAGCSASHGGQGDEPARRHASLAAAGHWSVCSASGMAPHHACGVNATMTSVITQAIP